MGSKTVETCDRCGVVAEGATDSHGGRWFYHFHVFDMGQNILKTFYLCHECCDPVSVFICGTPFWSNDEGEKQREDGDGKKDGNNV